MSKELWIYGIKNNETELLTAIHLITSRYTVMPSIVYGGLEYRVFVSDNSELLKLINSINNITGVMYTPERFTGMGLAINPDGTPWAEIGYMTDISNPPDVSLPIANQWYDVIEFDYLSVTWVGSNFWVYPGTGGNYNDVEIGVYSDEKPFEYHTVQYVFDNYPNDGDWYLFKHATVNYVGVSAEKRNNYFKIVARRLAASGNNAAVKKQLYKWRKL